MGNRPASHVDEGKADLLGAGLVALTAAQFGSVVVLGKVITDSGLSIPSFLAVRFAVACAVAGAALVVATGHGIQIDGTGVLFAFAAAIAFSLYLIGADVVLKGTSSLAGAMWVSG